MDDARRYAVLTRVDRCATLAEVNLFSGNAGNEGWAIRGVWAVVSHLLVFIGYVFSQAPLAEGPLVSETVQARALGATVSVRNAATKKEGSGALVGRAGPFAYVLTALHVVSDGDELEVTVFRADSTAAARYRSAEVIARSANLVDLALLRLATSDTLPPFLVVSAPRGAPQTTMTASALGCNPGKAPSVSPAKVSVKKVRRQQQEAIFWEADSRHPAGRSGGPLIDAEGDIIGVCTGSSQEKTYFVHLDEIHRFLRQHGVRWLIKGE